jgi:dienelactone hydrolase
VAADAASRPSHTAAASPAASSGGGLLHLALLAPTGPYPVGVHTLRVEDRSRPDPWGVAPDGHRELMITVRYPARSAPGHPPAPYLLPGEAAAFTSMNNFTGIPADRVDWTATRTHGSVDAPVARHGGPWPVVLHSPGVADPRALGSTLCEELASHGYVVVSVDHTYEPGGVEFPGGRVEHSVLPAELAKAGSDPGRTTALLRKVTAVRVADVRSVLDALPKVLPRFLRGMPDLFRVGMAGHSAGGFTAFQTMHDDARIKAAVNFDGVLAYVQEDSDPGHLSTVAEDGLDRPFLLVGKDGDDLGTEPAWASLWAHSTGWHQGLTLRGAAHATYTDTGTFVPQIAARLGLPRSTVTANIGTLAPGRAVDAQRACLTAFFGRRLYGRDDGGLLDGPSRRLPEARFFTTRAHGGR